MQWNREMKHTHWLYDPNSTSVLLYTDNNRTILNCLKEGAKLHMDNQWLLAMHTFHQHKLPTREGYYAFNYPRNEDGTPHYPQRDILIAHTFTEAASGRGTRTGNITGKMIVIDNLLDNKAFLWEADWYQIEEVTALPCLLMHAKKTFFRNGWKGRY